MLLHVVLHLALQQFIEDEELRVSLHDQIFHSLVATIFIIKPSHSLIGVSFARKLHGVAIILLSLRVIASVEAIRS